MATATFIQETEKHFRCSFHETFDLFCGTSTGAIIALALAAGKTGEDIVNLYERLGPTLFQKSNFFPIGKAGLTKPRYTNEALRAALEQEFLGKTLGDLQKAGKNILVPAFCITNGLPRIFKTDHSPELTLHSRYSIHEVALASSAAPTYFPCVEIRHPERGVMETFCDGGVAANQPGLLGFTEALHELGAAPSDIQLLSLSTPRKALGQPGEDPPIKNKGKLGWKDVLPSMLIDANSEISHQILRRLVESMSTPKPYYHRVTMQNPLGLAIDDTSPNAQAILKQTGHYKASESAERNSIRPFFQGAK